MGSLLHGSIGRALARSRSILRHSWHLPSEWWERVSRLTQEAPMPEPKTVIRKGSPPKKAMFSLTQRSACIWSSSP